MGFVILCSAVTFDSPEERTQLGSSDEQRTGSCAFHSQALQKFLFRQLDFFGTCKIGMCVRPSFICTVEGLKSHNHDLVFVSASNTISSLLC